MSGWALDLGTTNTGMARWDAAEARPLLVELPGVCRKPGGEDPLEAPRMVPSATHLLEELDFFSRIGKWGFINRRFFLGRHALIGRPALDRNRLRIYPSYLPGFKPYLATEPLRPVVRVGSRSYTARDVAQTFLRELLAEVKRVTGERVRELAVAAPVDAYEGYRAEVQRIGKNLGIRKMRFVDEPVAAAMGYGLGTGKDRLVLVADFGGGTFHLALIALAAREAQAGRCRVVAKVGRPLGGDLIDRWLMEDFSRRLGYQLREDATDDVVVFWYRLMLAEVRRVKEAVYFKESESLGLTPPDHYRRLDASDPGRPVRLEVRRDDVVEVLKKKGLYETIEGCLGEIHTQARTQGVDADKVDEVLMVGGSTLLPGIYPLFEARFGRSRVRAWQPFEAVAYGACVYSANAYTQSDFIIHDYAFVTHDAQTHKPEYTVIVPRGTRFPTGGDFWKRKLIPTCSLGEPETMFKLVIAEIGSNWGGNERHFVWDAAGALHTLGARRDGDERIIVPLNESNPALGRLDPPHSPSDRAPRLEICFGVNDERWLCATVLDLKTRRWLMREEPVVRLL
ncbi:MAG: Hsp70 family protein [Planctomycetes bacterium]|nr:Hsp70 family protein [Planctomycetota bacterium]